MLPLWYTAAWEAHQTGIPPVRPLFVEFPEFEDAHTNEDSFMLSSSILITPVLDEDDELSYDVSEDDVSDEEVEVDEVIEEVGESLSDDVSEEESDSSIFSVSSVFFVAGGLRCVLVVVDFLLFWVEDDLVVFTVLFEFDVFV